MTMPTGQYGTSHIAQWSILVASCEAPKRRHRASACAVLAQRTPWSLSSSSRRIHKTQLLLDSSYRTFLLAIHENFIPQNRPSTQLIEATIFVKIWNGKVIFGWLRQPNLAAKLRFYEGQKKVVADMRPYSCKAVNSLTLIWARPGTTKLPERSLSI